MKTSKMINYFDTPEERRKGRGGRADFMAKVIRDHEERLKTNKQKNEPTNNNT